MDDTRRPFVVRGSPTMARGELPAYPPNVCMALATIQRKLNPEERRILLQALDVMVQHNDIQVQVDAVTDA